MTLSMMSLQSRGGVLTSAIDAPPSAPGCVGRAPTLLWVASLRVLALADLLCYVIAGALEGLMRIKTSSREQVDWAGSVLNSVAGMHIAIHVSASTRLNL